MRKKTKRIESPPKNTKKTKLTPKGDVQQTTHKPAKEDPNHSETESFILEEEEKNEPELHPPPLPPQVFPGSRNFNCPICDQPFNRKYNRDQHISSHTKDVPCRVCSLSFRTEMALQSHLVATHTAQQIKKYLTITPRPVPCPKASCGEQFHSFYELYFHDQNIHTSATGPRTVKCSQCDKFFANQVLLRAHVHKKHTEAEENERTCHICDKVFASKQTLEFHTRIHTGSKPVHCKDCGESFRCQSFLKQHRISHHVQNVFHCALCGLSFSRSNYLRTHLQNHFAKGDKERSLGVEEEEDEDDEEKDDS